MGKNGADYSLVCGVEETKPTFTLILLIKIQLEEGKISLFLSNFLLLSIARYLSMDTII